MRDLIILGAGGNAHDVLDIVEAINLVSPSWRVRGLLDDRREKASEFLGLPILGPIRSANRFDDCLFINAMRNERMFRSMDDLLTATELPRAAFATLAHPRASVSSRSSLGAGVYVNFGVSVGGGVTIADHVSLGPGCMIGHDTVIEEYTIVAAGAIVSGGVQVESSCYIGSGAMIRQQLRIGRGALVGLGAVVVKDVAPGTTVVGNPAKPMAVRAVLTDEVMGALK